MTYQYPAAVFETEDGWTAVFPDLDGLTVSAATMEGLMEACREDMQAFLFAQKAQGARLPQASGDITAQDVIRRYSLPYASGNMEEITAEA